MPAVTALAKEAARLAITLPRSLTLLTDAACDDSTLKIELDDVLSRLGPQIWGSGANRTWLLNARGANGYEKDLEFENEGDRAVIVHHLRNWIFLKAWNIIRNNTRPQEHEPARQSSSATFAESEHSSLNEMPAVASQSGLERGMETHLSSDGAVVAHDSLQSVTRSQVKQK